MRNVKYDWNQYDLDCCRIGQRLREIKKIKNIYGIPRGGLIAAVILSHSLNKPLITSKQLITPFTLIVDDVSDSGETLIKLRKEMGFDLITATLWIDKETKYVPNYYINTKTKNNWVIFPFETSRSSKKDN